MPSVICIYGYWSGTSWGDFFSNNAINTTATDFLETDYVKGYGFASDGIRYGKISSDRKTIVWYSESGANNQCNDVDIRYYYFAFS